MNTNQKLATIAALGLFVLTIVFAPWQQVGRSSGHIMRTKTTYAFILDPPDIEERGWETRLAVAPLITAWAAIAILYAGSLLVLRKPPAA